VGISAELSGGRELDRLQTNAVAQPAHRQLVYGRESARRSERRRQHSHTVTGSQLVRDDQLWMHLPIAAQPVRMPPPEM
jgi:hypothetical protein